MCKDLIVVDVWCAVSNMNHGDGHGGVGGVEFKDHESVSVTIITVTIQQLYNYTTTVTMTTVTMT